MSPEYVQTHPHSSEPPAGHDEDGETDETLAASGSFKFSPHGRPTAVEAQVTSEVRLTTRSAELVIENVRGVTIRYDVECTYDYSR